MSAVGRETEQPGRAKADADSEQGAATPTTVVGGDFGVGRPGPGRFAASKTQLVQSVALAQQTELVQSQKPEPR